MYRQAVETKYAAGTGQNLIATASSNLQTIFNVARPGETIIIDMGATFTGNFTLPEKPAGAPIIVKAQNLTPENVRVFSERGFPKIQTSNAAPALTFLAGSKSWRFVNIEVGIAAGVQTNYGIVKVGDSTFNQLSQLPTGIIFDRCLIHGNDVGDCSRGVELNGVGCAVVDSSIFNVHGLGFDTQAICAWNGAGPFKIDNCFLQASGENIMFGGADAKVQNLTPSDIQITRNHCHKPLTWQPNHATFAGKKWSVKNLFELKNAAYVLVEGNVFENNWADGQDGTAILFTPRNQEGANPWATVRDVTFRNNEVINSPNGCLILGTDYLHPSQRMVNLKIINNLWRSVASRWLVMSSGSENTTVDHNTVINGGNLITLTGEPQRNFKLTRNICQHNDYGVIGDGKGPGKVTIDAYLPASVIAENVFIKTPDWARASYPNNIFAADLTAVGLDSACRPSGSYVGYGADIDAIEAAKRGAVVPHVRTEKERLLALLAEVSEGIRRL